MYKILLGSFLLTLFSIDYRATAQNAEHAPQKNITQTRPDMKKSPVAQDIPKNLSPATSSFKYYMNAAGNLQLPGISLGIASIPNLRDMGGYITKDGKKVKSRLIYRSNEPAPVSQQDKPKLAALHLVNDFDLRTAAERKAQPDEMPNGVKNIWLDILGNDPTSAASDFANFSVADIASINKAFAGDKIYTIFKGIYQQLVSSPDALKYFSQFYHTIKDQNQLPSLFHCTTGKDRTGWAAASLLWLLGVNKAQIYYDYLQTNNYIIPFWSEKRNAFVKAGGSPTIIDGLLQSNPAYLDAAFKEAETKFGSMENYFEKGLNLSKTDQEKIKAILLESN